MNFLAMPTLKNERACFLWPISISPLRSLNETFDSARIGMAKVGSFDRSAAVTTMSAMPISFFSTTLGFFCLVGIFVYFLRWPALGLEPVSFPVGFAAAF